MNIRNSSLKVRCDSCKRDILITFNTNKCPKCGNNFDSDGIHNLFYDAETKYLNSNYHKISKNLETTGNTLNSVGNFFKSLGCLIFSIPFVLILLSILKSLLK